MQGKMPHNYTNCSVDAGAITKELWTISVGVYVTMYNRHNVDGNTIFQHNSTFSGLTVIKLGSAMLHTTSDD